MTQSTFELIEAHTDQYELEDSRTYKRTPRPYRRRETGSRRRGKAKLTINGRNTSRSTDASMHLSRLAMKLQTGNA